MQRFCSAVLLWAVLVVSLMFTGCGGSSTSDNGGGVSTLRVLSDQIVRAQELSDGSFSVTAQPLLATGGSPLSGYTWSLAAGSSYPPGTTVAALTGVFDGSGNGLTPGRTYPFTVQVSDGSRTATGTINLAVSALPSGGIPPITVFQQPMGVPIIRLPIARTNQPYGASLQVYGGDAPYSWLEDDTYAGRGDFALSGLRIDMARGIVRGTVMNSARGKTLRFRLVVRDNNDDIAATDGMGPTYEIVVQ